MQKLLVGDLDFGYRLKSLRRRSGLSQYDMETQFALRGRTMSRSQYANIEQGKGNVFISDLILIKEILNVSYSEFFEGLTPPQDV